MSCGAPEKTFRLLDAYVGWDPDAASPEHLVGLDDPAGIHLARLDPEGVNPSEVNPYLPPPVLTPGCEPCEWFLAAPALCGDPLLGPWKLMRLDSCSPCWQDLRMGGFSPGWFNRIVGIAFSHGLLAVSEAGGGTRVFSLADGRVVADVPASGPVAFTSYGDLLVACVEEGKSRISRFDRTGRFIEIAVRDIAGAVEGIGAGADGSVWLLVRVDSGGLQLLVVTPQGITSGKIEDLAAQVRRNRLRRVQADGFCVEWAQSNSGSPLLCSTWFGECVDHLAPSTTELYEKQGQLLTLALDSRVPGCRWHRVQVDADVPTRTCAAIAIATSEDQNQVAQGDPGAETGWTTFNAGVPHSNDWESPSTAGASDFLISHQPAGRYLFLRLRLSGDGLSTPVVRRIRLEFERSTSLEYLPAVYRENPEAEDFTERFLSIFDSLLDRLDGAIQYAPAMLDVENVPEGVLPWLGSFYDLVFEHEWSTEQRRRILKALPGLFRHRGTPAALRRAIQLVFGVDPAIQELPFERAWTGLGPGSPQSIPLGQARLFSRSRSRLRLGGSPLGSAPLRNFGDPALDAIGTHAYRFRVRVPSIGPFGQIRSEAVQRLVDSQKPAHTLLVGTPASLSSGFLLGGQMAVGIDTRFSTFVAPKIGQNTRLSRRTILWHSAKASRRGFALAGYAVVGVSTQLR